MAKYHRITVNGMNYREYAADAVSRGVSRDTIADDLEFKFGMPESLARSTARVIEPATTMELAASTPTRWQDESATRRQREYLAALGVRAEPGLTKGRASQLIDAAKNSELGSVGGWYSDGSN